MHKLDLFSESLSIVEKILRLRKTREGLEDLLVHFHKLLSIFNYVVVTFEYDLTNYKTFVVTKSKLYENLTEFMLRSMTIYNLKGIEVTYLRGGKEVSISDVDNFELGKYAFKVRNIIFTPSGLIRCIYRYRINVEKLRSSRELIENVLNIFNLPKEKLEVFNADTYFVYTSSYNAINVIQRKLHMNKFFQQVKSRTSITQNTQLT